MLKGFFGALVGGAIGAAIWAAVVYFTGYEVGWIAWGIGALSGFGMAMGVQKQGSAMTGGLAALVAICALLIGKYAVVNLYVNKMTSGVQAQAQVTMDDAKMFVADQLVEEYKAGGKQLMWAEGYDEQSAEAPEHYPKDLWADLEARWGSLTPTQQEGYRLAAEEKFKQDLQAFSAAVKKDGFTSSFELWDILWFGLAILSAFRIGTGSSGD